MTTFVVLLRGINASSNPLLPRRGADEKLFHGTFRFQPVPKADFRKLELPARPGEQAVLIGQVVLLHCPHGYGRTMRRIGHKTRRETGLASQPRSA